MSVTVCGPLELSELCLVWMHGASKQALPFKDLLLGCDIDHFPGFCFFNCVCGSIFLYLILCMGIARIYIYINIYKYIYLYIYIFIYIYINTFIYLLIYVALYLYIYIYIYSCSQLRGLIYI